MIATTTTTQVSAAVSESVAKALSQRRRITPQSGRALEKLSHAIDYLSAESAPGSESRSGMRHRMEAERMLKALRREILQEAPVVEPFRKRCRTFVLQFTAWAR